MRHDDDRDAPAPADGVQLCSGPRTTRRPSSRRPRWASRPTSVEYLECVAAVEQARPVQRRFEQHHTGVQANQGASPARRPVGSCISNQVNASSRRRWHHRAATEATAVPPWMATQRGSAIRRCTVRSGLTSRHAVPRATRGHDADPQQTSDSRSRFDANLSEHGGHDPDTATAARASATSTAHRCINDVLEREGQGPPACAPSSRGLRHRAPSAGTTPESMTAPTSATRTGSQSWRPPIPCASSMSLGLMVALAFSASLARARCSEVAHCTASWNTAARMWARPRTVRSGRQRTRSSPLRGRSSTPVRSRARSARRSRRWSR